MVRTTARTTALAVVLTAALAVVPVANGTLTPAHAAGGRVEVVWSSEDGTHRLDRQPDRTLEASSDATTDAWINVDPGARHQTVLGEGTVLEGTSVWNIMHLSPEKRDEVMHRLFDPVHGNGYDLVRIPMGAVDQSPVWYTYADTPDGSPDPDLDHFSIQQDVDLGVVALAKQALKINPDITFFMSMWTAPAWMKSNNSLINGGEILPEYYPALARYQRMAIQAYQAQGIPIHAMTPQNEPHVTPAYPSVSWSAQQMRDYIRDHLGPELTEHQVGTEIWIGDDNIPTLMEFAPVILDDPGARQYVRGLAMHDYANHDPAQVHTLQLRYPDLPIHLTERSYYGINGEVHKGSGDLQLGMRRLIDHYRSGLSTWTYWINFVDDDGGPSIGPLDASCCSVPFTAPADELDNFRIDKNYYLYGQLTRFVHKGAVRIGSDQTSPDVSNVAFRNPDGTVVVVVANGAQTSRSIRIQSHDGVVVDTLPAMTMGTYSWAGAPLPDDPRLGTFRLVNRADASALHATREHYRDLPETNNVVASPTAWNFIDQRWTITSAGGGYYRITSALRPSTVLQATGDLYRGWPDVHNVAATPAEWHRVDQLWRIEDAGEGHYRILNRQTGAALQGTGDVYPYGTGHTDVFDVVVSPAHWDLTQQEWRLVPD